MSFLSTATGVAVIDARTRSGTITLPLTSQIPNRYFQIKDLYGAFSRSSLTVSTQAGETFDDGTTSKLYTDPFTFLNLYAASTTRWAILGGTQTISQTISSLNVSSITIGSGLGWLQLAPVQTVAMSTNTINADTIITNSTTSGYISAQVLYVSSILGVTIGGGTGNVTTANLTSTVGGLGQIYISTAGGGGGITTANLVSTTANLQSAATQFVSSLTINTLTIGSGAGWLQLPPVQTIYASTTIVQGQALYSLSSYFGNTSSATALQFNGLTGAYTNTVLAEISTGAGTQEFLVFKGSSASDRVRVQTTGAFVVETGVSARVYDVVATQSNATPAFVINTSSNVGIQTANPGATLDVAGTGRFLTLSSLALNISSINGTVYTAGGGGTSIPQNLSTAAFFTSSILASTITTSSLQVNSLTIGTGTGWVNLGPLQTVVVSSLQENTGSLYAANAYIGIMSTASALQFNGLQANYTNTVLAEISTGAGTQELLIFKGSSASDRVRVQTTGDVRFETGVSARLWSNTTVPTLSNVTPAMIINSSSNVGIQTASPATTLDVAGTGRFQTLSTLALNISSINGSVYSPGGGGGGTIDYLSAFTVSTTDLFASTISSFVINVYGVIGSAFLNNGPDDMAVTSLTNMNITSLSNITISPFLDLTLNNSQSTLMDNNALYINTSNEIRMVSPQVITENLYANQGISTYSLTIYGPSTLTVQGWSYFQNTVSTTSLVTNAIGVIDSVTGQPSYIQASNGSFDFNGGGAVLDQAILTSTIEGLGSLGYISTPGGMVGVSQIIAGSNITIDPIEGTGIVTINASGGGGGPSEPIPFLSSYSISTGFVYSPLQLGTDSNMSYMAFYGADGTYTQSVVAEEDIGGGNQELLLFRGSNATDRIRFQTTGSMIFEAGVSSRVWPSAPSNAIPSLTIDTSSNVGIQTATPGATLDVVGTGRFTEVSTITVRANTVYANVWNVAIQTI